MSVVVRKGDERLCQMFKRDHGKQEPALGPQTLPLESKWEKRNRPPMSSLASRPDIDMGASDSEYLDDGESGSQRTIGSPPCGFHARNLTHGLGCQSLRGPQTQAQPANTHVRPVFRTHNTQHGFPMMARCCDSGACCHGEFAVVYLVFRNLKHPSYDWPRRSAWLGVGWTIRHSANCAPLSARYDGHLPKRCCSLLTMTGWSTLSQSHPHFPSGLFLGRWQKG